MSIVKHGLSQDIDSNDSSLGKILACNVRCQPHTKTMRDKLLQKEGFHGQKRDNTKMNDNSCDKYTSLLLTIRFFHTVCSIILNCGNFSSFQKFLWHLQIITVGIAVQFTRHKGT